jgi:hypothetical protein
VYASSADNLGVPTASTTENTVLVSWYRSRLLPAGLIKSEVFGKAELAVPGLQEVL